MKPSPLRQWGLSSSTAFLLEFQPRSSTPVQYGEGKWQMIRIPRDKNEHWLSLKSDDARNFMLD